MRASKERDMRTWVIDADQAAHRSGFVSTCLTVVALLVMSLMVTSATAGTPEDDARATFDRFVAAQNAHDIKAVEALLLGSADFLWITRGTPVWGREAAIKRFAALYEGTWRLEPEAANLKISSNAAIGITKDP